MAPVLVCPECNAKHPLGDIGERTAFPCTGCGRQLKVPAAAAARETVPPSRASLTEPPPRRRPPAESDTRVLPVAAPVPASPSPVLTEPPAPSPEGKPARNPMPPRWARSLVWIGAVPLAFAVVLPLARGFGMLTSNQIQDLALAEGWGRFWPIVRLLPIIAFAAAVFVQGGISGVAKLRERRWAERAKKRGKPKSNGTRPQPPRGRPSRSRPQSTRTRA